MTKTILLKKKIEIIHDYKSLFFDINDANLLKKKLKKIMDKLFFIDSNVPSVIRKLVSKLIIFEFEKLTNHHTVSKIAITSNKIENCFLKNFLNHMKKLLKTDK